MTTIGIDIGGRTHVAARCRDGESRADREILRVGRDRAGFAVLDAWLEQQPEPVTLVTMESSGHYWMPLASHLRRHDVPVAVVVGARVPPIIGVVIATRRMCLGDRSPSESSLHPTTKPLALVERAIRNSSRPGDLVFDPFGGSGTTLIAAAD